MNATAGHVMQIRRSAPVRSSPAAAVAFSEFYRREHDGQVRRAALMLRSDEAANDVVHDAFVQVYQRWDRLDDPGPYLNRAVLNGCRDAARRRVVAERVDVRLQASDTTAPNYVLFDVLEQLPFNQRAAVVLRFYGRLTENEIADALDCKPGSVGPWIKRALDAMRKELS